jgi:hypothetical protein
MPAAACFPNHRTLPPPAPCSEALGPLTNLQALGLSHNFLDSFPEAVAQLARLRVLYLGEHTEWERDGRAGGQGSPARPRRGCGRHSSKMPVFTAWLALGWLHGMHAHE